MVDGVEVGKVPELNNTPIKPQLGCHEETKTMANSRARKKSLLAALLLINTNLPCSNVQVWHWHLAPSSSDYTKQFVVWFWVINCFWKYSIQSWKCCYLKSKLSCVGRDGSVNSIYDCRKFLLQSNFQHFTESRFTSVLCRKFQFLPESCNFSNFTWNHAKLISFSLKIMIDGQLWHS